MKIQKRLLIEVPKTKDAAAVHNDKKPTLKWQLLQNSLDKNPPLPLPTQNFVEFFRLLPLLTRHEYAFIIIFKKMLTTLVLNKTKKAIFDDN